MPRGRDLDRNTSFEVRRTILALVCFCSVAGIQAGEIRNADREYRQQIWKREQGLPDNAVEAITQTRDGYLWIGTRSGLARFDGVRFTVFNRANTPALANDYCTALAEDRDGSLWIGTQGGLVRMTARNFTAFTAQDGLSDNHVLSACASRDGGIWIGTTNGLSRFHEGRFTRYSAADGLNEKYISALHEDRNGDLWIGNDVGLVRRNSQKGISTDLVKPFLLDSQPKEGYATRSIQEDRHGFVWAATTANFFCFHDDEVMRFAEPNRLLKTQHRWLGAWATSVRPDREGNVWLGLRHEGLVRYRVDKSEVIHFDGKDGLSDEHVLCLYEDNEGSLWIGTELGGLNRWRPAEVVTYSTRDGLVHDNARTFCEAPDGSLWIGTEQGLSNFKDGRFQNFTKAQGLPNEVIRSLALDANEDLWIGLLDMGMIRFSRGNFAEFRLPGDRAGNTVRVIHRDHAGTLWIGSKGGLHRMNDGRVSTYTTHDGLSTNEVRALLAGRNGALWIGTFGGGLNRFQAGAFSAYRQPHGLSSDIAWALHEDGEDVLWIGTDHGLNRFKDGRFTVFTQREGLFDDLVNHILEDDSGNLWISCDRGIYRVRKRELDDVAEGRARLVNAISYGEADGMESSVTKGKNTQPAAAGLATASFGFPRLVAW